MTRSAKHCICPITHRQQLTSALQDIQAVRHQGKRIIFPGEHVSLLSTRHLESRRTALAPGLARRFTNEPKELRFTSPNNPSLPNRLIAQNSTTSRVSALLAISVLLPRDTATATPQPETNLTSTCALRMGSSQISRRYLRGTSASYRSITYLASCRVCFERCRV